MRLILTLFVLLIFTCSVTIAQAQKVIPSSNKSFTQFTGINTSNVSKNELSLNLFGHGVFYSFSYLRHFIENEKTAFGIKVAAAYYPERSGIIPFLLPLSLNHKIKIKQHSVVMGYGITLVLDRHYYRSGLRLGNKTFTAHFVNLKLGYRYDFKKIPFFISPAFTPLLEYQGPFHSTLFELERRGVEPFNFIPFGGLEFGYRF